MDFFHGRPCTICPIHNLCGIKNEEFFRNCTQEGSTSAIFQRFMWNFTSMPRFTVVGKVIATQCNTAAVSRCGKPFWCGCAEAAGKKVIRLSLTCLCGLTANREGLLARPFFDFLSVFKFQRSPAIPTRDTGVWAPGHRNTIARLLIRKILQAVEIANGHTHPEVLMREHVKPAQREDQKHLRRPDPDTFDLDERLDNLLVGHARQPVEPQTTAPDAFCQIQQVRRFLRRNANRSQLPWS